MLLKSTKNNMKIYFVKKHCRLCNSKLLIPLLRLPNSPLVDDYCQKKDLKKNIKKYPLVLMLCKECKHVQLSIVVNPKILYHKYIYQSSSSSDLKHHFYNYYKDIIKFIKVYPEDLIVDIGSNDGLFLKNFKNFNKANLLGVDPSPVAKVAIKKGIKTINCFFNENVCNQILKTYNKAKIITANNVFSHIDKLKSCLENVKKILSRDGVFIFEVFHLQSIIQNKVIDYIYHEHLDYHSITALEKFFFKNKMKIINIQKINTKGGSIRVYVSKLESKFKQKTNIINKFKKNEKEYKIFSKNSYINFQKKINNQKNQIHSMINKHLNKGYKILSYGASATSTVFNIIYDLNKYFEYIIDDNPIRQGRFSPFYRIKIISKNILKNQKKFLVIVSSWRFYDVILKNNSMSKEAKFVRILPTLKIQKI